MERWSATRSEHAEGLTLGARVTELDRILVTGTAAPTSAFATRMRRNAHGGGYFLTGDQIERRAGQNMTGVLLTMPTLRLSGVSIDATGREWPTIMSSRKCIPTFYLDGVKIPDGASALDALVSPISVGGVEVYADPTQMPAAYFSGGHEPGGGRSLGACALVLVWTKGSFALR